MYLGLILLLYLFGLLGLVFWLGLYMVFQRQLVNLVTFVFGVVSPTGVLATRCFALWVIVVYFCF